MIRGHDDRPPASEVLLDTLPPRTLERKVRAILQSNRAEDADLQNALLDIAAGNKREWTLADWQKLTFRMEAIEESLRWFLEHRLALPPPPN